MNVKNSVISLCVTSVMMGVAWETAVAKQAEQDDDSVKRWGRWAVLSPAAGQEEAGLTTIAAANDLGSCESSENCPGIQPVGEPVEPPPIEPPPPPPPPPEVKSPCKAGMPCGFARIDYPYVSTKDGQEVSPDSSEITKAQLTLVEGEGNTAQIVLDPTTWVPRGLDSGTLDAPIFYSDVFVAISESSFLAGVITDNDGSPAVVNGPWEIGASGGEYVWGTAATVSDMDSMRSVYASNLIATYTGTIAGSDNRSEPSVTLSVNFTQSSWSGNFNDNQFTASGDVIGSGFVSTGVGGAAKSGLVYGAFVNAGNNAIGAYDVALTAGGRSTDVFSTTLQPSQSPQ